MNALRVSGAARLAFVLAVMSALTGSGVALAQQKSATAKALLGQWNLISIENEKGEKSRSFGENPRGLFIFAPNGRYSLQIFRADLPKFASNNRLTGTPEENKAVVQGTLAHFGTYKVDEKAGSFTIKPEGSSYPNWTGVEQPARTCEISGDNLKSVNPSPSTGSSVSYLMFKRIK